MTAMLRGRTRRAMASMASLPRGRFCKERHHRIAVRGAGVADRLRLAAKIEDLVRRMLERLVEDLLAQRQRRRRSLREFERPSLGGVQELVGNHLAIENAEREGLFGLHNPP